METAVLAIIVAVIGAAGTVAGTILGRGEVFERFFASSRFPKLAGTRWLSIWREQAGSGEIEQKEIFEFTKQRRSHLMGYIVMDTRPDLKWEIEGDYNDRFLRLFLHPSRDAQNKFFLDYGCYFFERQGDGSFNGHAVGFDSDAKRVVVAEHVLRQLPPRSN